MAKWKRLTVINYLTEYYAAGMEPRLVHARKAKLMLGSLNKTDKLDARGLNKLQRTGTLPCVWIPPGQIRDQRELTRTRLFHVQICTKMKNRLHSSLSKYGRHDFGKVSDIFGKKIRPLREARIKTLPPETRMTTGSLREQIDDTSALIRLLDTRIKKVCAVTEEMKLVSTVPGIGSLLSVCIVLETGTVKRFPRADKYAAYAGTVPRVHQSGGKTRYGPLRPDVNRYLKWAFSEAANSICVHRRLYSHRHAVQLYNRIRARRGHATAIGAVAHHLAEAVYWILTKKEPYIDPALKRLSSRGA